MQKTSLVRTTAGQPDEGTTPPSTVPVQVSGLSGVESLSAHQSSVYALTSDGTVWTWGSSDHTGQPDDDTTMEASAPVRITGLPDVESLQVQHGPAYALKSDGTVWAWGWNQVGQLGNGTRTDSSVPVPVSRLNR